MTRDDACLLRHDHRVAPPIRSGSWWESFPSSLAFFPPLLTPTLSLWRLATEPATATLDSDTVDSSPSRATKRAKTNSSRSASTRSKELIESRRRIDPSAFASLKPLVFTKHQGSAAHSPATSPIAQLLSPSGPPPPSPFSFASASNPVSSQSSPTSKRKRDLELPGIENQCVYTLASDAFPHAPSRLFLLSIKSATHTSTATASYQYAVIPSLPPSSWSNPGTSPTPIPLWTIISRPLSLSPPSMKQTAGSLVSPHRPIPPNHLCLHSLPPILGTWKLYLDSPQTTVTTETPHTRSPASPKVSTLEWWRPSPTTPTTIAFWWSWTAANNVDWRSVNICSIFVNIY